MTQAFKNWLTTRESDSNHYQLKQTVVANPDRAATLPTSSGRERIEGLPKDNRPPHLLYSHSDPVVGKAQKDINDLQQRTRDVVDAVAQSKTVTNPMFQAKMTQFRKYATMAVDGLNGMGILLTWDNEGARRAKKKEEAEEDERAAANHKRVLQTGLKDTNF